MHILSIRWAYRLLALGLAVALAGVCRTDAQTKETPSRAAAP